MDEQDEFVKYVAGGIFRYGHAQRSSDVILWFAASGAFCIGSNDRQRRRFEGRKPPGGLGATDRERQAARGVVCGLLN